MRPLRVRNQDHLRVVHGSVLTFIQAGLMLAIGSRFLSVKCAEDGTASLPCIRFGVDVLWPAVQRPQPLPCPRCGGRRVLELQLMPGLLAALEEGLAWVELRDGSETGCTAGGAPPSLDHWTWLTIAVFTCANSCGGSSAEWTFAEEQVEMCIEQ